MKNLIAPVLAAFVLATPALAQQAVEASEPTPTEQPAPGEAATPPSRTDEERDRGQEVVCRSERATGSLTRVNRVCKTRDEWNGVYDSTRSALDVMSRTASTRTH